MREDLLHFIWKNQKFRTTGLRTTGGASIQIIDQGQHNSSEGPDFFNARLRIAEQLWAGNVEIHLKSSDWYAHSHEIDDNYGNVVLHVVWEDDVSVFRKDGSQIPALELKTLVPEKLLASYQALVHNQNKEFINCERHLANIDGFVWNSWLQRLFVSRLEQKAALIWSLLQKLQNDWEGVLFILMMKNLGLNRNGSAYLGIAEHLGFSVVKKVLADPFQMESLLYGTSGLLEDDDILDDHYLKMKKEFQFLEQKFRLPRYNGEKPVFFGLRPSSFPTIRLSQLTDLYQKRPQLFKNLMEASQLEQLYGLLSVSASRYWNTHYTFGKTSAGRPKKWTREFINLLIINLILPLKFCYQRHLGKEDIQGLIFLLESIPKEKNSLVSKFGAMGKMPQSALESQAIIQLYHNFCSTKNCLQCAVGVQLLGRKI